MFLPREELSLHYSSRSLISRLHIRSRLPDAVIKKLGTNASFRHLQRERSLLSQSNQSSIISSAASYRFSGFRLIFQLRTRSRPQTTWNRVSRIRISSSLPNQSICIDRRNPDFYIRESKRWSSRSAHDRRTERERRFRGTDRSLQHCRMSSHFLWQRGSNDRGTQLSSVQRATCSGFGRSRRVASGRATRELTFPRNKFHLVRGQITDVMRMVGAVGNYVFAVIGSPGPRRARKATTRIAARIRDKWR